MLPGQIPFYAVLNKLINIHHLLILLCVSLPQLWWANKDDHSCQFSLDNPCLLAAGGILPHCHLISVSGGIRAAWNTLWCPFMKFPRLESNDSRLPSKKRVEEGDKGPGVPGRTLCFPQPTHNCRWVFKYLFGWIGLCTGVR